MLRAGAPFVVVFTLLAFGLDALAQSTVNQGAPGNQGPWSVGTSPYRCRTNLPDGGSTFQRVVVTDGGPVSVPAQPTYPRMYVVVTNAKDSPSGSMLKCRSDSVAPSASPSAPGTVLGVGDSVPYSETQASGRIYCIGLDGGLPYVDTYECLP
jgi:hypothetical protein